MQDSANDGWQELQLPSRKECPKLFYSLHTSKDSFTLLLTDLISIWECSLDKYDILAEAARQQASIDPSESTHQFGLLLSKLRESLQDLNGQNALVRDSNHISRNLLLRTIIDLPRPLKPLDWTFRLGQKNASELAEQLLRPSLHEVSVSQDKIGSLVRIIKDKDHVISRLLDRIGTSAIDLGLIFPGIAGTSARKGSQLSVADAKKHVAGMATFEEKSWIKQFSNNDGYEGADRTGLRNLVRGCEKCFVHTREQHEDWLSGLGTSDQGAFRSGASNEQSRSSTGKALEKAPKRDDTPTTGSDDDFERQATPPQRRSKDTDLKRTLSQASSANDEVDSEDDPPRKKKATTTKIGILGRRNATKAFGGSKANPESSSAAVGASSSPRYSSPRVTARSQGTPATAGSTATASDSEAASTHRNKSKSPVKDAPKQRAKLGGGLKKKQPDKQSPSSSSSSTEDEPSAPPTSSHQRKSRPGTRTRTPEAKATASPAPSSQRRRLGGLNKKEEPRHARSPSSTPEAEDLDAPSPPHTRSSQQRSPPPPTTQTTPSRRLGRLGGGRKATTPSASPSPQPKSSSLKKKQKGKPTEDVEMADGPDRNREMDSDATPSPSPSPSLSPSSKPSGTRQHPTRTTTTRLSTSPSHSHTKKPTPPTKSGTARGADRTAKVKAKATAKEEEEEEENPPLREEEEKEETDEAKANRRREELKRSIASGAGVRKKRRF